MYRMAIVTEHAAPYAFVCYSHEDVDEIDEEVELLKTLGFDVRFDKNVVKGPDWIKWVAPQIEKSAALLFYVSQNSIESQNCRDEVDLARLHQLPILLSFLSETPLPSEWSLRIGSRQALYKSRESDKDYTDRLQHRLAGYLNQISPNAYLDLGSERSIAVLPFAAIGKTDLLEYVANNLSLEIHALLELQPGYRVIARQSSFEPALKSGAMDALEFGKSLGVDRILLGEVSEGLAGHGPAVSFTLQRVADGRVLRADTITDSKDQAELCMNIVSTVVGQPDATPLPQPFVGSADKKAHQEFVKGQTQWNRQDLMSLFNAIHHFTTAISFDPLYFDAHIAMAKAFLATHSMGTQKNWVVKQAGDALQNARNVRHRADEKSRMELGLSTAYRYRIQHWTVGLGYEEHLIHDIIEANPSDYAFYDEYGEGILMHSGLYPEAIDYLEVGEAHDPHNIFIKHSLALLYGGVGRLKDALDKLDEVVELDPGNGLTMAYRAAAAARLNKPEIVNEVMTKLEGMEDADQYIVDMQRAACHGLMKGPEVGQQELAPVLADNPVAIDCKLPFLTGLACMVVEDLDKGFEYWQIACDAHDRLVHHVRSHITYFCNPSTAARIRRDQRYLEIMDTVSMGSIWVEEAQQRARALTAQTGITIGEPTF